MPVLVQRPPATPDENYHRDIVRQWCDGVPAIGNFNGLGAQESCSCLDIKLMIVGQVGVTGEAVSYTCTCTTPAGDDVGAARRRLERARLVAGSHLQLGRQLHFNPSRRALVAHYDHLVDLDGQPDAGCMSQLRTGCQVLVLDTAIEDHRELTLIKRFRWPS